MSLAESIANRMQQAEVQRKTKFSLSDYDPVAAYVSQLLAKHASGETTKKAAMNHIMTMLLAVDNGDVAALKNMTNTTADADLIPFFPNWPSKTGNPSGVTAPTRRNESNAREKAV